MEKRVKNRAGERRKKKTLLLPDDKRSVLHGAGDEARTRYLDLGKVALYQMSYTRGTFVIIA